MTRVEKRNGECSQEIASSSAMDSKPAPSFEFSVTSEEGINLFVDMNCSSVDWYKRLENDICACRCLEENKFKSFREELLYLGNNYKQTKDSFFWSNDRIKDDNPSFDSSPNSFNKESENSFFNHPDAKNGPMEIFVSEACSFAQEESERLEQRREHPISISSNSGVEDLNSSPRPEEMGSMNSNACHVPQEKIASCSTETLAADGSQPTLDNKNMKLHDDISMNVKIKKGWNLQSSAISAIESKLSEVGGLENDTACSSFVNDPWLNLIDAAHSMEMGHGELAKSVEIDQHACLNILSAEEASGSPTNGTEASCKSKKEAEKFMSDGRHKRKRYNSRYDKVSLQFSRRVLRSAAHLRRSRHLVSKVCLNCS